jgi:hypothetical protein
MAHHIFICHSSRDQSLANAACAQLESVGIKCWIAPRDPAPGLPYGQQIVRAIAESTIVLFVFSTHANESRAVLGEIELASNRGKIILPLRIEDIAPSERLEFYIRSVHWQDALEAPFEAHLEALTRRVQGLLGTSTEVTAPPAPAEHPVVAVAEHAIPAADLVAVTAQLAVYVGPVARVLVARYAQKAANVAALCDALGAEISDPAERRRFLAATRTNGAIARPGLRWLYDETDPLNAEKTKARHAPRATRRDR